MIFDGPLRLGTSLELREDFYAVSYLYQFKRAVILNDGVDSDWDESSDDEVAAAPPTHDDSDDDAYASADGPREREE